ncbi:methyltransferase [Streptomyces telluris]|uniref:Acetylserotonin O-methyltransferase n=1 Tax=Streptomyces telluris TaxID=2720021 RepID=A0A9X2LP19_9ACTN|nr:methyltransferase [Streptomyces telluris]MCQ8774758.1 acetylserotonin O-methyltransferase [Streptomyces telluris]NJP80392.1 methyltransferase [Streptomyces telluris]
MTASPSRKVLDLMIGYWASQSVYVATKLGLPEHIENGLTTSRELAEATGSHERSLFQLMRFLTGLGILQGDDETGFSLTPAGELLKEDAPDSLRDLTLMYGEEFYETWGNLLHNVKTGQPAFEATFGAPMYPYFTANQESARRFDGTMAGGAFFRDLPQVFDFSSARTVVDIAGGTGALLSEVLKAAPHVEGVLFDQAHVIEAAKAAMADRGLTDRVSYVEGDYTASLPTGGDVYLWSRILHSRSDESCIDLLKRCHDAMNPDGTVVVLERTIPPTGESSLGLWFDLQMMVLVGGTERSEQEYADLFAESGLVLHSVLPLSLDMFAIVARRA